MVPEPLWEPINPVLLVASTRHRIGAIWARDSEREDKEDKEESDENGHAYEVKSQETLLVPVSTDKASQRDEEDKKA